jgi:glycosyltransferase involved in cell wall biosynthesis
LVTQGPKPLITTIIPTYRRPKLLRRAISSVLAQTYPHFRLCVYDNASGDETASVVVEFARGDPRVHYHCQPENIGALRNFIYGAERVDTPFFSFLSDDDLLLPAFYETALAGFEKYPEAILSVTPTLQVDGRGVILKVPLAAWKPGLYHPPKGLRAMLKYKPATWTGVLFRREVIEKVGMLDEEVGDASDLDFELRAAARFPVVVSRQPGAIFSFRSSPLSDLLRFQASWPGWEKMIRNLTEDKRIPAEARLHAEQALREGPKRDLFRDGLGSILRKDWAYTDKAVEVLHNHYNSRGRAFLLRGTAKMFRFFPPVYYVSFSLIALRRALRKLFLQKNFKAYAPRTY